MALTLLLFLLAAAPVAAPAPDDPARLVVVQGEAHPLLALGLDVIGPSPDGRGWEVIARDRHLAKLVDAGLSHHVRIEDVEAYYASRLTPLAAPEGSLGSTITPGFGMGGMGGFHTYAEVVSILDQMAAQFPALITAKTSLGTSIQGRDLWAVKISDNPNVDEAEPEARFDALHHAREPLSLECTLWFMLFLLEGYGTDPLATYLVNERELWFVPVVNPDGYVHNQNTNPGGGGIWRKNRRNNGDGTFGVDLNRNYPFQWGFDDIGSSPDTDSTSYRGTGASSEPETAAMVAFLAARGFDTALSSHTRAEAWLAPFGYDTLDPADDAAFDELGALATEDSGYVFQPAWEFTSANGITIDHDYATHGTFAWSPEIGPSAEGFWPPTPFIVPSAEANLRGFQVTALAAGPYTRITGTTVAEIGDGDGHYEPGEMVAITVTARNSGRAGTSGSPTLTLSTSTPGLTVVDGSHTFAPLASFTDADNAAAPLLIAIDAGAARGTLMSWTLTLDGDGLQDVVTGGDLLVGEPHPFIVDDVEIDLGWTAGLPGDTATGGFWERAVPTGTQTLNQDPINPSEDATPGPGVNAFVTDNTGGSPFSGDVDGGFTTLMTPPFDLSGSNGATLSYARWHANLAIEDDVFEVALSNDGGNNWTPVEIVEGNANTWTTVSVPVESILPQTANMRLRFVATDEDITSLTDAGVDDLRVDVYDAVPRFSVYGTSQLGTPVRFGATGTPGDPAALLFSPFTGLLPIPEIQGPLLLDLNTLFILPIGVVPANGLMTLTVTLPTDPIYQGVTIYFQVLLESAFGLRLTNRDEMTLDP